MPFSAPRVHYLIDYVSKIDYFHKILIQFKEKHKQQKKIKHSDWFSSKYILDIRL